jgi:hypothetical protein
LVGIVSIVGLVDSGLVRAVLLPFSTAVSLLSVLTSAYVRREALRSRCFLATSLRCVSWPRCLSRTHTTLDSATRYPVVDLSRSNPRTLCALGFLVIVQRAGGGKRPIEAIGIGQNKDAIRSLALDDLVLEAL